jgi:hypothetical protein
MNDVMQKILYTTAGILLVVGAVIYWGFRPFDILHVILIIAVLLVFLGLHFTYKIAKKNRNKGKYNGNV